MVASLRIFAHKLGTPRVQVEADDPRDLQVRWKRLRPHKPAQ
jgi:hypothetical protein